MYQLYCTNAYNCFLQAITLLQRAHCTTLPVQTTSHVLGIDDFAFHEGQVYGIILTDGETHAVVDMLPDRCAKTTTTSLRTHPGIQGCYAEPGRE